MSPLAKKVVVILYLAFLAALFVNYQMAYGWFRGYDKAVIWVVVALSYGIAKWLKSRAENRAQSGEVLVEALDAEGAVRSDPKTERFVLQMYVGLIGVTALIGFAEAYQHRGQGLMTNALMLLLIIVISLWVLRERFGKMSQVEWDDGVTLSLRQHGQTRYVPWSQVESVDVSRPYALWQVTLKFRPSGESKLETAQFLPLGWRKMTPAAAEKLKAALETRRIKST